MYFYLGENSYFLGLQKMGNEIRMSKNNSLNKNLRTGVERFSRPTKKKGLLKLKNMKLLPQIINQ